MLHPTHGMKASGSFPTTIPSRQSNEQCTPTQLQVPPVIPCRSRRQSSNCPQAMMAKRLKTGDKVTSKHSGVVGEVVKVMLIPHYVVRWDSGYMTSVTGERIREADE